jgi:hypothetical protein
MEVTSRPNAMLSKLWADGGIGAPSQHPGVRERARSPYLPDANSDDNASQGCK